jgi:hypothetical protein
VNLSKNLNTSTIIIRNMGQNDLILLAGAGIAAYFLFSKRGDETLESYTPPPSYDTLPPLVPSPLVPSPLVPKIPDKTRKRDGKDDRDLINPFIPKPVRIPGVVRPEPVKIPSVIRINPIDKFIPQPIVPSFPKPVTIQPLPKIPSIIRIR